MPAPEQQTALVGAIVGEFIVGDGTVVGPPIWTGSKPHLILAGKSFTTHVIAGNVYTVYLAKARLKLAGRGYDLDVSSSITLTPATAPLLNLRGKSYVVILPTQVHLAKASMTLAGKHFNRVTSYVLPVGKSHLILKGKQINRVGRAGLIPTAPVTIILTPTTPHADTGLVPSPAYTELLVPTAEKFV